MQKPHASPQAIAESFLAQAELAKLELAQGIYDQWRSADSHLLQREFAVLYTNLLGVPPQAQEALRQGLELVARHCGETVQQVVTGIRQQFQLNGGFESPLGNSR